MALIISIVACVVIYAILILILAKKGRSWIGKFIGLSALYFLIIGSAFFIWFHFYFVFGESWTAGTLNYITKKGYIFKTYEGKLIQEGYGNNKNAAANKITSNEFEFSVEDAAVAEELQHCAGKHVEVHYREYKGALPWRGMQRKVVDSIANIVDDEPQPLPVQMQSVVY